MKWILLPAFAGLLALSTPPCEAAACSCAEQLTVPEARDRADAVFAGTVTRRRVGERKTEFGTLRERVYTFRVRSAWKGVQAETVEVRTGMGGGDCGMVMRRGEVYLVYAYVSQGDGAGDVAAPLRTGICTRTATARDARGDVHLLGDPERTWPAAARSR